MKVFSTLFIVVLAFSTSLFGQTKKTTYYDVYTRTKVKDVYYVNSSGKKNGVFKRYSPDQEGTVILKTNFVNGNINGKKEEFYSLRFNNECSQLPHTVSYYSQGTPHGDWYEYTCTDELKAKRILIKHEKYDKNKADKEGIQRPIFREEYTKKGTKKGYGNLYNGLYTEYFTATGKPLHETEYKNFEVIKFTDYWKDENGNIQREIWEDENGKEIEKEYDEEGRVMKITKELNYALSKNEITEYYESGNVKKKYVKIGRDIIGEYSSFHDNGSVKELAQYNDVGKKMSYFALNEEGDTIGVNRFNDRGSMIGHNIIITDIDNPKALVYDIHFNNEGGFDKTKLISISNTQGKPYFKGYLSFYRGFENFTEDYEKPSIWFYDDGSVKTFSVNEKVYRFYENGNPKEILEVKKNYDYNKNYTFNEDGTGDAKYDYKHNIHQGWHRGNTKYAFPKNANFIKIPPVSIDDLSREYELDKTYMKDVGTGAYSTSVREKKKLFKKYEILLEYYRKNKEEDKIGKLYDKMESLINEDTSELEKSLKKLDSPVEIEEVLLK